MNIYQAAAFIFVPMAIAFVLVLIWALRDASKAVHSMPVQLSFPQKDAHNHKPLQHML